MLRFVVRWKFTRVSEVPAASIIRAVITLMEAVCTFETSVNFYKAVQCNIP
jgi:hypothetical protein